MKRAWWFAATVLSVSVAVAKDPMVLAPPPNQPPKVRGNAQVVPASASAGETSAADFAAQRRCSSRRLPNWISCSVKLASCDGSLVLHTRFWSAFKSWSSPARKCSRWV